MHRRSPPGEGRSGSRRRYCQAADRLGFHAPTMTFPGAGHADDRADRIANPGRARSLCDAMIAIRREITEIENGRWKVEASPCVTRRTRCMTSPTRRGRGPTPAPGMFSRRHLAHDNTVPVGRVDNSMATAIWCVRARRSRLTRKRRSSAAGSGHTKARSEPGPSTTGDHW